MFLESLRLPYFWMVLFRPTSPQLMVFSHWGTIRMNTLFLKFSVNCREIFCLGETFYSPSEQTHKIRTRLYHPSLWKQKQHLIFNLYCFTRINICLLLHELVCDYPHLECCLLSLSGWPAGGAGRAGTGGAGQKPAGDRGTRERPPPQRAFYFNIQNW